MNERSSSIYGLLSLLLWILTLFCILWSQASATSFVLNWTDRDVSAWLDGFQFWKGAFSDATQSSVANETGWELVKSHGLAKLGCSGVGVAPVCGCLSDAHALAVSSCVGKGNVAMKNCFMSSRPVQFLSEMSYGSRPYLMLFQINSFGALAACVALAKSNDKPMLPYNLQIGVALLALVIFSVLQPSVYEWIPFLIFLVVQILVSWLTRRDDFWKTDQFYLLYGLVMPLMTGMSIVMVQRRDLMYIVFQMLLSYTLVFAVVCRFLLCLVKHELDHSIQVVTLAVVLLILSLMGISYNQFPYQVSDDALFRSSMTSWLVLKFYLVLALFKPNRAGLLLYGDLFLRTVLTGVMLNDL